MLMLHCTADLYGSSRILLYIAAIMRKKGHQIIVVLPENGPLKQEMEALGVDVRIINMGILRRKYFTPWGMLGRFFLWIAAIFQLSSIILSKDIQLVYSNTSGVIVGAIAAAITRTKHFWHIHEIIEKPRILAKFIGFIANRSQKVIVVSQAVYQAWVPFVKKEKLYVLHNGIDNNIVKAVHSNLRQELGLSDATVIIGMIGRVMYWKGQGYFLEMASHLQHLMPNTYFVLVGDAFPGYEYIYQEMDQAIQQYQLEDKVKNLGYRTDIPNIMSGFDIFVSPSTQPDPFPTVVLEAMACHKPVVATEHGGVLEMLESGVSGVFIPIDNAEKAAKIIHTSLNTSEKREKMGEKALARQLNLYSLAHFEASIQKLLAH